MTPHLFPFACPTCGTKAKLIGDDHEGPFEQCERGHRYRALFVGDYHAGTIRDQSGREMIRLLNELAIKGVMRAREAELRRLLGMWASESEPVQICSSRDGRLLGIGPAHLNEVGMKGVITLHAREGTP